jgi:heptosyltransferase II
MAKTQPPAQRILVIRYRFIGDTILTVPFLRNLRRAYPSAQIDVLVGPQSGEVLTGCPYVNELITFDTTRFHKYDRGAGEKKSFWHYVFKLRKERYDLVFVLKRSWSSAFLALLIGARYRVGYATEGRQILLTHSVPFRTNMHEVDSTLSVLEAASIPILDRHLEAFINQNEQKEIAAYIPPETRNQKRVLIHAAAAHPDKLYPLESWARVVRQLHEKHGFIPFFTGALQDFDLYEQLQEMSGVKGVNLAGKLSLRLSMALYSNLDLAICTDSGPAHLAAAVGIPTLSIFGPTDPIRWRPYSALPRQQQQTGQTVSPVSETHKKNAGPQSTASPRAELVDNVAVYDESLPCRPCNYHKTCDDRPCLTQLSAEIVVDKALNLLNQSKAADALITSQTS